MNERRKYTDKKWLIKIKLCVSEKIFYRRQGWTKKAVAMFTKKYKPGASVVQKGDDDGQKRTQWP